MKHYFSLILLGLGSALIISSCNPKQEDTASDDSNTGEEVTNRPKDTSGIAIAFYYQDSIATKFRFYKHIDSMLKAKELNYQKQLEQKYRAYQAYEADIQKRMDNGEITGYQLDDIRKTAAQKQQSIQAFEQQRGTALQKESMEYQIAIMNKIAESGKEFSDKNDIDLLFFYQKGGQITFINNAYDVTEQFIRFLNKREEELKSGVESEVEELKKKDDLDDPLKDGLESMDRGGGL